MARIPAWARSEQVLTTNVGIIHPLCIDLFHDDDVGEGQNLPFTTSNVLTDGRGNVLSASAFSEIAGLSDDGDSMLNRGGIAHLSASLNDFSASIQLAAWAVGYPDFSCAGNDILSNLETDDLNVSKDLGGADISLISLNGGQGLVVAGPVPKPGMMTLIGSALFGLGTRRSTTLGCCDHG